MPDPIRILLLADSHLGFDLPARPRVARRRRGYDFLANYAAALEPALAGAVDVVVHGGDVFDRPSPSSSLAYQAFAPLVRVAERSVPVFVVPGNHERSLLPRHAFAAQRNVHVFDRPRTFTIDVRGATLALSGFPCERRDVRTRFTELVERTQWHRTDAALRLLCVHHCVEGARVGPGDFTFTTAPDVIRARDVPASFAAVLSGHIHRHQVLTHDLRRRPLATPVLYPGSIERTSIAEIDETKGYMIVHAHVQAYAGADRVSWEFRALPARPMIVRDLTATGLSDAAFRNALAATIASVPPDAVLRIRVAGTPTRAQLRACSAARVRALAPASMNVEIRAGDGAQLFRPAGVPRRSGRPGTGRRTPDEILELDL